MRERIKGGAKKFCQPCYWISLKGRKLPKITRERMSQSRLGDKNWAWKGGKAFSSHGYIRIKVDGHPYADCNGYVYEHRYLVERKIGRTLSRKEVVHHINGIKTDNRLENLQGPLSGKEHIETRAYFANQYGRFKNKRLMKT